MTIKIRRMILKLAFPIIYILGRARMPFSKKRVTSEVYREARKILRPGYLILTRTLGEVTTMTIPGHWKHAAVYDGVNSVIEANGKGVIKTDLIDFIMKTDYIKILRPKGWASRTQMQSAAKWSESQLGKPYDYMFEDGDEAYYCSELCVMAYIKTMGPGNVPFKLRSRAGVPSVTPDDLAKADKKWESMYEF